MLHSRHVPKALCTTLATGSRVAWSRCCTAWISRLHACSAESTSTGKIPVSAAFLRWRYSISPSFSDIPLHPLSGLAEQHSVMGGADNLDDAVHAHAVDDKMPGAANALPRVNEPATQAKRVNTDTGDPWDVL
jgi:hypothetical protein